MLHCVILYYVVHHMCYVMLCYVTLRCVKSCSVAWFDVVAYYCMFCCVFLRYDMAWCAVMWCDVMYFLVWRCLSLRPSLLRVHSSCKAKRPPWRHGQQISKGPPKKCTRQFGHQKLSFLTERNERNETNDGFVSFRSFRLDKKLNSLVARLPRALFLGHSQLDPVSIEVSWF